MVGRASFESWKVWERGSPQVAVEVISTSDQGERSWLDKLEQYRRLGVSELVRFDPTSGDRPLRIWDSIDGDLLERQLPKAGAASRHLGGFWLVLAETGAGLTLRLSHDEVGASLFQTPLERKDEEYRAEVEARRAETEAARVETEARLAAEARVRELEAELRRNRR